jgi:hypothetical protein
MRVDSAEIAAVKALLLAHWWRRQHRGRSGLGCHRYCGSVPRQRWRGLGMAGKGRALLRLQRRDVPPEVCFRHGRGRRRGLAPREWRAGVGRRLHARKMSGALLEEHREEFVEPSKEDLLVRRGEVRPVYALRLVRRLMRSSVVRVVGHYRTSRGLLGDVRSVRVPHDGRRRRITILRARHGRLRG